MKPNKIDAFSKIGVAGALGLLLVSGAMADSQKATGEMPRWRQRLADVKARKAWERRISKRRAGQSKERRANRNGKLNAPIPAAKYVDVVSEQGQNALGFYVNAPFAKIRGAKGLADQLRRTGLNAAVIDLKDGAGRVTYDTKIALLEDSEDIYLDDPKQYVSTLKEKGIYTIARIVCFADPKLPLRHPERAIVHNRRGTPWVSHGTGGTWLDPYNRDNHTLVVELAKEAAAMGFDEVQLDYIRWPVDPGIKYAAYPSETDEPRSQVLLEMMRRIDAAIPIPIGVDVFGLTAFNFGNVEVLGQFMHEWTGHVEVFTPMIYVHAMRNWSRGVKDRNRILVQLGLSQMRSRLGPVPVIRPFLQSFDRKTSGAFNPHFIAQQVLGAKRGGADGFLFWHPGSNYRMLQRGMSGPARRLTPFDIEGRNKARQEVWKSAKKRRKKGSLAASASL